MRTFVAISLPDTVKLALASVQDRLKASNADVKWVIPQRMHLTVQFLGELDKHRAGAVSAALDEIAAGHSPFRAALGSLGTFPALEQPRVIWLGINQGASEIVSLADECARAMETLGITRQRQELFAHVTIGRVRSGRNRYQLKKGIEEWRKRHPTMDISLPVGSLTFYKSDVSLKGPVYTILHEAIFAIT
jgi:RNA 2',3'-cyclic 3'-phosphodiesterase